MDKMQKIQNKLMLMQRVAKLERKYANILEMNKKLQDKVKRKELHVHNISERYTYAQRRIKEIGGNELYLKVFASVEYTAQFDIQRFNEVQEIKLNKYCNKAV